MAAIAIIFFILSWIFCYVILRLDRHRWWRTFRCWYSVWGIFCVVMANWYVGTISTEATIALALTFGVSFPAIYAPDHILWHREGKKRPRYLRLFDTISNNGRLKKS